MEEVTLNLDKYDSMIKELDKLRSENKFLKKNTGKIIVEVTNNTFPIDYKKNKVWDKFLELQNLKYSDEQVERIKFNELKLKIPFWK